jgi:murein DD-endopeptidase MepM/ murein hydrolase activator NlpD
MSDRREPRPSWWARRFGGPVRVLIVREAKPVREVRFDPRHVVRAGAWVFVAGWLVPAIVLGSIAGHAQLERRALASQVATLTADAKRLSTSIAELERYAGVPSRASGEGGPAAAPPDAPDEAAEGAATFVSALGRRFATAASAVTLRIAAMRGTPTGIPVPDARTSSTFGWRANPFTGEGAEWHAGLDFPAPVGTPVEATADGTVERVGDTGGYGLAVIVRNSGDYSTIYGHLRDASVREGDAVTRGRVVGHVGSSGRSTGPHVHYEVRRDGRPVNPRAVRPPATPLPTRVLSGAR